MTEKAPKDIVERLIKHATVSRVANGKDFRVSVAKKLLPFMETCPCCGQPLTAQQEGTQDENSN